MACFHNCHILFILNLLLLSFLLSSAKSYSENIQGYSWDTEYFEQKIDHYDYRTDNTGTYKQRYLINSDNFKDKSKPIFFYTGNEGDITLFAQNTGFIWDNAHLFGALIVFAEHRYYGSSLPFGSQSFANNSVLAFFTVEQALRDYVELIAYLKGNVASPNSPVIAFGGSYGGMLSAWLRMKYPNAVVGAYAASAPIFQFTGMTPCETFNSIVTRTYNASGENCPINIRNSWKVIRKMYQTGQSDMIFSIFNLCEKIPDEKTLDEFIATLTNIWVSMAMADYPYPANFLANLPAWPVASACNILNKSPANDLALMELISEAVQVFTNYSKSVKCFNFTNGGNPPSLTGNEWPYQFCTEIVMPMCSDGINDMFEAQKWDFESFSKNCMQQFNVTPDESWAEREFNGKNFSQEASNIYFTNGHLDPWSGAGVLSTISISNTLIAYVIEDGAHHVDLRGRNSADTPSITAARLLGLELMTKWINQL